MNVTIIGTGGGGLTRGQVLNDNGHHVSFWTFSQKEVDLLSTEHQYKDKLPGVIFPESFTYTTDMKKSLEGAEMVLFVVPSQVMGNVSREFAKCKPEGKIPLVVCATKGILEGTDQRMSEVILENVPWLDSDHMVTLSGPTHAEEVSRRVYTTIVAACPNEHSAKEVQKIMSNNYLRVYTSTDQIGVELCGAIKNVIAIASGVLYGIGAGDNTRAALITRGQAEICRLGRALGANPRTFAGLAGMGDLIVTCLSQHSRNRYVGECIGKGEALDQIMSHMKMIAEGVPTCKSAKALAEEVHVELPIVNAVYEVLFNNKKPADIIEMLMTRDLRSEEE